MGFKASGTERMVGLLLAVVELYGSQNKKLVLEANSAFAFSFYTVLYQIFYWIWPVWKHPEAWQLEMISKAHRL